MVSPYAIYAGSLSKAYISHLIPLKALVSTLVPLGVGGWFAIVIAWAQRASMAVSGVSQHSQRPLIISNASYVAF